MGFICAFLLATTFCKIPSSNAAILDTPAGKMMVRTLFQMMKISPINCDGSFIMNVYGTSKLRYPHFCEYDSSNSDKCIPYRKMKEDNALHTTMCSIWDNVRTIIFPVGVSNIAALLDGILQKVVAKRNAQIKPIILFLIPTPPIEFIFLGENSNDFFNKILF